MNSPEIPTFDAYAVGACYASVCTNMSDEAATERLNADYPTGVGPWHIADEPFRDGSPNPSPCETLGATHRHILFAC